MNFKVGDKVRLCNLPDPAWFDPTMLSAQPNFLAMPLDKLLLRQIEAKGLCIGIEGSVGEILEVDENTKMLYIQFEHAVLDNVPFNCCVEITSGSETGLPDQSEFYD